MRGREPGRSWEWNVVTNLDALPAVSCGEARCRTAEPEQREGGGEETGAPSEVARGERKVPLDFRGMLDRNCKFVCKLCTMTIVVRWLIIRMLQRSCRDASVLSQSRFFVGRHPRKPALKLQ